MKTGAAWNRAHRGRMREIGLAYRTRLRDEVFAQYGKSCRCCGESDTRFLTLDHIHNDGAEHRRRLMQSAPLGKRGDGRGSGANFYAWLKRNGFPSGLQVL